jgi:hypothetical protein
MAKDKNEPQTVRAQPDPRLQIFLTLNTLLRQARHKGRVTELEFLMVNQTFNLIPYRHCVFWLWDGHDVTVKAASGLVQLDPQGPYVQWLRRTVPSLLQKKNLLQSRAGAEKEDGQAFAHIVPVSAADCEPADAAEWKQWVAAHALLMPFTDRRARVCGGLWIDRDEPFDEIQKALLEDLCDGYAHAYQIFTEGKGGEAFSFKKLLKPRGWKFRLAAGVALLALLIPVRTSVTAPAEIVPKAPYVVSVPFDGIIKEVEVSPGQMVKKGDLLARMDATMLENKSELSTMEMATAQIALSKTEREALADKTKLADIGILRSQVEQKNAEKEFAAELLERSEIRAERDGVVIFADANALRGKPAQTGQQIMLLADPDDSELLIRIPVESMIRIDETVPASFFLNVSPLGFNDAHYESIGYQATPDPDGLLTYKVRARFDGEGHKPRIGWTGTGKVYGKRTILLFNILRRPLVTLRHKIGI